MGEGRDELRSEPHEDGRRERGRARVLETVPVPGAQGVRGEDVRGTQLENHTSQVHVRRHVRRHRRRGHDRHAVEGGALELVFRERAGAGVWTNNRWI